ncbi:hypothetical protein F0U44_12120 [Nocardioides humilatus]|uniref:Uncharacterized protein n=1 Tax=Nocardioides humilatus TaxID=2607660 RepID=A0A5B1LEN4_9ACTN|nr:hypothetical protein [Nocardioides humilatus]KAA1419191.1 hypothetical protein F0U44_12120 [Nocardioides humilatus]
MTDTRFTTVCDDSEQLLAIVDIEGIGDIETLLMFLFGRPIGVAEGWCVEGGPESLEVTIDGNVEGVCFGIDFPMSLVQLVRSCAEDVSDLGPFRRDDVSGDEETDVASLSDDELITALQQSLGKVRIFNMLNAAD